MALQVAASSTPLSRSFRSPWKAASAFWKLLPKVPSISPPEKCARSSRIWARTTAAPLAPSARFFCAGLFTALGSTAAIVPCSTTAENAKLTQRDIIRKGEGTPKAVMERGYSLAGCGQKYWATDEHGCTHITQQDRFIRVYLCSSVARVSASNPQGRSV